MSAPTSRISVSPIVIANQINRKSFLVPFTLVGDRKIAGKEFDTKALIDSGAGGNFLDENFVRKNGIPVAPLKRGIKVYNVDGT